MKNVSGKYLNRELSWLEFNQRVLEEALDVGLPLLERLKFLAITASNLDEFFMVRVGGLQLLVDGGKSATDPAGLTATEQLAAVNERTRQMVADQYACFNDQLEPALIEAGIRRLLPGRLSERQRSLLEQVFESEVYPVFTPQAVTVEHFPLLVGCTLNVCVRLGPAAGGGSRSGGGQDEGAGTGPRFAVIPFGRAATRFLTLHSDRGYAFMLLEDAVRILVERFFPGEPVVECVPFRITRNADIGVRDDLAADLLAGMQELLTARRQGDCVRLELAAEASPEMRAFLREALQIDEADVFAIAGPLDLAAFLQLAELKGFDALRYETWSPQPSPDVDPRTSLFEILSRRDLLLCHPYESFEPVVRLVEEAAEDPDVLAIKQILYRTSRNSPIVAALARAARRGKHVTVIVELKARFDEARNIEWAKNLEHNDVQVIYGVKGLKTHAKLCIIVRREPQGIQRYVHFGTGNYNEITARLYSDVSYLTANEELGADASSFFNAITGYTQLQSFRKIAAAPLGLRDRLLELINAETERRRQGQKAHITAKLNSLVDPEIIQALYGASQAGVKVRLNIRGICCLRPGVPGLSENITVVSIVDRFLEHARILYFYHGGDERVYISSADWMPRNLDRRVELLVPIENAAARQRLIADLDTYFQDTTKARVLRANGSYERVKASGKRRGQRAQEQLYRAACQAVVQAEQSRRTVFEPHRAPSAEDTR
ncbi:MAG: polyphosphate kinase 1 [Pirellulales bacterium]